LPFFVYSPLLFCGVFSILSAATGGYLDNISLREISAFETALLSQVEAEHPDLVQHLNLQGSLPETMAADLNKTIAIVQKTWLDGKEEA
jgi:F0F1-type ATP synthase alpha subunit